MLIAVSEKKLSLCHLLYFSAHCRSPSTKNRRVPRVGESFVRGVSGAESAANLAACTGDKDAGGGGDGVRHLLAAATRVHPAYRLQAGAHRV